MLERHRLVALVATGVFLATLFAGIIVSRDSPEAYDTRIMLQVTRSILDDGDFKVADDEFGFNSPYASYGLGMSALFLIPTAIADATGGDPDDAAMMTNAYAFAFVALAMLMVGRTMGVSWARAATAAGLVAAGTLLFPYAATGFSELPLAAAVALGLAAVAGCQRGRSWAPAVAGIAIGVATLLRTDSLVVFAPAVAIGILLGSKARIRDIAQMTAVAAPFLGVWCWYNALRFGSPFKLGYAGTEGFDGNFWAGMFGLTLSPGRGVLWFVPLVVLALLGMRAAWRINRAVTIAAIIVFGGRLLLFAAWSSWWGGVSWGPRFLVPAMPALAVGMAGTVSRYREWPHLIRACVVTVCIASVAIQVVGATTGYEYHWNQFHTKTEATDDVDAYLYDWQYFPVYHQAGWMVWRPETLVGRLLPPAERPGLFVAFLSISVWGIAAVAYGAWRLDREADDASTTPTDDAAAAQTGRDEDLSTPPISPDLVPNGGYVSTRSSPATSSVTVSPSR